MASFGICMICGIFFKTWIRNKCRVTDLCSRSGIKITPNVHNSGINKSECMLVVRIQPRKYKKSCANFCDFEFQLFRGTKTIRLVPGPPRYRYIEFFFNSDLKKVKKLNSVPDPVKEEIIPDP